MTRFFTVVLYFSVWLTSTDVAVGRNVGKFWQVTDFHYDSNYSLTGDKFSMCHNDGKSESPLGKFGNYLCDSPWSLVTSAVEAMLNLEPNPDFIIWTGDSVPHINASEYNLQKNIITIKNLTSMLLEKFPSSSIYPVLGNHDPYPSDQMPFSSSLDSGRDYYLEILNQSGWNHMIGHEEQKIFPTGGYYSSVAHISGIRLLCLNTNLYYKPNLLVTDVPDPGYQFAWMENQLSMARKNKEKVYLVAHIAPGAFELTSGEFFFYKDFNKHYLELLIRYNDVIMGQFYGHEHTDSFRVVYDRTGNAIGQMFLSPAVTPWKKTNNPSVRLYHYDTETGEVLDIFQYYLNLTEANAKNTANWKLEYQLTKTFGIPDATPNSMASLVESFLPKSENLNKYLQYNRVGNDMKPLCNHSCYFAQMCAIINVDLIEYSQCLIAGVHPPTTAPSTLKPPSSTTDHHHREKRPIPRYMYYVIGTLVTIVLLLFIIVAILCVGRRNHMAPLRYSRLPTYAPGYIN